LDDKTARLAPVALPRRASEREAAEFAEGLAILDGLVARLRAHVGNVKEPQRNEP
jgi:hypothetical protein